jgi:glycosyltransferase involved in cell wall biosynthesis
MVEMIAILSQPLEARLVLAGNFSPPELEEELRQMPGWHHVDFLGWQYRRGVAQLLAHARVGLALLHPCPHYLESYPVKLFEYMSAGIPVIASNFPLWREIVEGAGCGILVDPMDPKAIATAIRWLSEHPEKAKAMGKRGQESVRRRYNWHTEAKKLTMLYQELSAQG